MKGIRTIAAVLLVLLVVATSRASDISGSASVTTAKCQSVISVSGKITLDTGDSIASDSVTVDVFQEGQKLTSFYATFSGNSFSGSTSMTSGTYTLILNVTLQDSCMNTDPYAWSITGVTVP